MISRFYSFVQAHSRPLAALALCLYGMYYRCVIFSQRGFYPDELNQLNYTSGSGLLPFWKMYTRSEITAFPGDYLLTLPFVKLFGTHKWLISIPHIVTTIIGFYLLYILCTKYIKTFGGLVIVFLIANLNFNLAYHAFEFRPYSVLPTLAMAVFLLSERIVCRPESLTFWKKTLIGIFFFITVGFHAYGILIVALFMFFFILQESHNKTLFRTIQKILPFSVILAVFAVPLFIWYYIQNAILYTDNFSRSIHTFQFIPNPLITPVGFLRTMLGNLSGARILSPLVIGALISFVIPNKDKLKQTMFIAWLVIIPIELILLTDLRTGYWFLQRQFVWVIPFFAVWLGWCWDSVILYLSQTSWAKGMPRLNRTSVG